MRVLQSSVFVPAFLGHLLVIFFGHSVGLLDVGWIIDLLLDPGSLPFPLLLLLGWSAIVSLVYSYRVKTAWLIDACLADMEDAKGVPSVRAGKFERSFGMYSTLYSLGGIAVAAAIPVALPLPIVAFLGGKMVDAKREQRWREERQRQASAIDAAAIRIEQRLEAHLNQPWKLFW